ncbi:hypothetical protein M3Y94_00324600 [Aphelenchoides besseyi]|nr:hypothetical protein M3Y94_00324600 [Aphelenchoides besseyi]KAI6235606.1 hypothetical protein M3Y95_00069500 [Aphelenchoides besseyi]
MEAPWNLCSTLSTVVDSTQMDSLDISPSCVAHINNETKHLAAQRRSSTSYENPYARQLPQYSVQGSTSTPNSVGPSSGSVSPDASSQLTESNGMLVEWIAKPMEEGETFDSFTQPVDSKPRYCYVLHNQHPATASKNDSFNSSSISTTCASNASHRPMHLVLNMPSPTSLHFSTSPVQRSNSVPRQSTDVSQSPTSSNDNLLAKGTKRKSSQESNRQTKKPATSREPTKTTPKSGISALTRRRLRIVQGPGETMPRKRLPLAELTVEDLKTLCRKKSFPISGTKADLYKRLQPIEDQLDIEAMLLEAIEEEDHRLAEINANKNNSYASSNETITQPSTTTYTTKLLGTEQRSSIQTGVNQFDVAISDYLMQHQKQLNQHSWSTSNTPKTTIGDKSSFSHLPPLVRLVPRKTTIGDNVDSTPNGSTFSYAEMGSGGQFTFETTAESVPSIRQNTVVKLISETSKFGSENTQSRRQFDVCCAKCMDKQNSAMSSDCDSEELQQLIKELALSPLTAAADNPTLTAKILALHERVIGAQTAKLRSMASVLAESQQTLHCQQRLIETARWEAQRSHSNQPSPIESLLRSVDVLELEKQHAKQTDELRKLQHSHQRLKSEQETLSSLEMELQEEIHVEQAVEDVARLIRTNRRTALLIVQLVHKFQCDRMRELDQSQSSETTQNRPTASTNSNVKPNNATKCTSNVATSCGCARRPQSQCNDPTVVVIDESDEENSTTDPTSNPTVKPETLPKRKNKSKSTIKRNGKHVSQRSEHTFAQIMEDIFQTVISERDEIPTITEIDVQQQTSNNQVDCNESLDVNSTDYEKKMGDIKDEMTTRDHNVKFNDPASLTNHEEKSQSIQSSFIAINKTQQPSMENESMLTDQSAFADNNSMLMQQSISCNDPNSQIQANAANYDERIVETEMQNTDANMYLQRRVFLQQKKQNLCEQLQQIEIQQRRNELQIPYGSSCQPSVTEDELGCGLNDLDVEELYNCDLDPYEMSTSSLHAPVPMNAHIIHNTEDSYSTQFHSIQGSHGNPETFKTSQRPPTYFSSSTFPPMHSNDFEDILDLIHNGETKWCGLSGPTDTINNNLEHRPITNDVETVQATNAIYQELRQTDNHFQQFTPMQELDGISWSNSMMIGDNSKTVVYSE